MAGSRTTTGGSRFLGVRSTGAGASLPAKVLPTTTAIIASPVSREIFPAGIAWTSALPTSTAIFFAASSAPARLGR